MSPSPPSAELSWVSPGLLKIRFAGHHNEASIRNLLQRLDAFPGAEKLRGCFLETSQVQTFDTSVRGPGRELLAALRARGVDQTICLGPNPLVRMLASTLAFAAGLPMIFVNSEAEALNLLREPRK
jgi:hypothetical protein